MAFHTTPGFILATAFAVVVAPGLAQAELAFTKHNLSASGPGQVKAFGKEEMCIFCHAPHVSDPATPMWNPTLRTRLYTPYSSPTMQARPGQPTSDSKLCLSCHDGTIALGAVLGREPTVSTSGVISDRANLTTDLSDDHPISFEYDYALAAADPELASPAELPEQVPLDANDEMQCTTCHDPHSDTYPMFLVMDHAFSALCLTCHEKAGWLGSSHDTSPATWRGGGTDPWPHSDWETVAANGCESCHAPHAAGSPEWLLNFLIEEDNCLACHGGDVAQEDIATEMRKPFRHRVDASLGIHDPTEDFEAMPRHVECQDCHNPHAASEEEAQPPHVSGALRKVAGITQSGARTESATYQYEVCYRCHADSPNAPAPAIDRQVLEPNIRLKLEPSNPSFHPVVGPGRNPDVPSLISPLIETSLIYCTDCHASDSGPGAGGFAPAGPHGSNWRFLLEREYRVADNTPESYQAYALCYKCHDRQSILGDQSFRRHREHIEGEGTPCSVCHDPHGISATRGGSADHSHLINFDASIVFPAASGRLEFLDDGPRKGRCYLSCHGKDHDPEEYGP